MMNHPPNKSKLAVWVSVLAIAVSIFSFGGAMIKKSAYDLHMGDIWVDDPVGNPFRNSAPLERRIEAVQDGWVLYTVNGTMTCSVPVVVFKTACHYKGTQ